MDTRGIIMNAAFELFETKSFRTISVEEIIAHAHVSRRSFYRYYRDKYELMHQYFKEKIGDNLVNGYNGSNWYELTKKSFEYFQSHSSYISNVKEFHGQDSIWQFLLKYVQEFYISVKCRNKREASELTAEETAVAEGIAVLTVHFYECCFTCPANYEPETLTAALASMIPLSYREYL